MTDRLVTEIMMDSLELFTTQFLSSGGHPRMVIAFWALGNQPTFTAICTVLWSHYHDLQGFFGQKSGFTSDFWQKVPTGENGFDL